MTPRCVARRVAAALVRRLITCDWLGTLTLVAIFLSLLGACVYHHVQMVALESQAGIGHARSQSERRLPCVIPSPADAPSLSSN